jgi:hydroxymethylbilane synthase
MSRPLRLGTRRSPLALHQADLTRTAIHAIDPDVEIEIVEIVSEGDSDPRELRDINDRGIFAHALERQLRDGTIDAAVHSSKDLALEPADDLVLAAWLPRADPRDALVNAGCALAELALNASIATGSARRFARSARTFDPRRFAETSRPASSAPPSVAMQRWCWRWPG